jgi:class 3 adenylate cyclase
MESASRTLVCSVLFADIVEYSRKAVAEQLALKQAFNRALAGSLVPVAVRDRVVLDTGDGAAVTFLGDPEEALFAAMAIRDARGAPTVRLGINLGPVRLVRDLNGRINIIGDGINVAQRVMSFARPGQLLVARSFYEVVSRLSRDYAGLFKHEGSRTDKHVREHDVYSVGTLSGKVRRAAPPRREAGWFGRPGPFGFARSALVVAPLAFALLAAGGVAVRAVLRPAPSAAPAPLASPAPAEKPAIAAAPAPAPAVKPPAPVARPAAPPAAKERLAAERAERLAAAKAEHERLVAAGESPGRIVVAVAPWGEVLVDGRSRGVSPPLQVVVVKPGPHLVEIRNTSFPPYVERVVVKPGEPVRVTHRFR